MTSDNTGPPASAACAAFAQPARWAGGAWEQDLSSRRAQNLETK